MESYYYLIYLAVVLLSSSLIMAVGRVRIGFRNALMAILPVLMIFVAWDIFATWRGHWEFGLDKMLGIVVLNQPVEELLFFIVVPLFYLVVWEMVKRHRVK